MGAVAAHGGGPPFLQRLCPDYEDGEVPTDMRFDNPEDIIQLTPLWKGERFPNGRPKVPDNILERMRKITLEEAWGPLWMNGYKFQFEGDFKIVHPNRTMVGRAVTAVMVPMRPDLHETLLKYGHEEEGRRGFFNQWVIDQLVEDDVVVVDMFDKVYQGTYIGGNLGTAIATRTKRGGAVIWGGIRDLQQVVNIEGINVYYRGVDPTPIMDVTMVGMNVPARIGKAICLPGDIVVGTPGGVIFVPPHLAEETVVRAEKSQVRDISDSSGCARTCTRPRRSIPNGRWRCGKTSCAGSRATRPRPNTAT